MERDFTQETQDRLKSLVREADVKWCSATDWLGDQVLGAANALGIIRWFTDADGYQRRVFDMHNASEHELQEIFDKVYGLDAEYNSKFKSHTEQLQVLHERIRSTAALVCAKSAYQSATEKVSESSLFNERNTDHWLQTEVFKLLKEDRFSEEVWKTLSDNDKMVRLEEFYQEVQDILGTKVGGVDIIPIASSKPGFITNGVYDPVSNRITLNSDNLARTNSYDMFGTIIHEVRHAYQWEAANDHTVHDVSIETRDIWENNYINYISGDYDAYISQPIEFDAGAFARQQERTNRARPSYRGSW
jgi:hypothetical protein